ncbi:MAG: SGNH/GDSL hydrolase family protein [Gammaproteobacteria bacterium]
MATTDYTYSQIEGGLSGFFDDNPVPGTGYRGFSIRGVWAGIITGTEASFAIGAGGDYPLSVIVDGSFSATPIISSGRITLFTGLSDTAHLVSLHVQGAYSSLYNWMDKTDSAQLRVDGASPVYAAVPVNFPTNPDANLLNSQPTSDFTGDDANVISTWDGTGDDGYAEGSTNAKGQIIFRAQCSDIYLYASSEDFFYSVDGGTPVSVSLTDFNTGQGRLLPFASGLDDTAIHEYRIWPDLPSGSTAYIHGVAVFDDGVPVSLSSISPKTFIIQFGNSITDGEETSTGVVDCWLYGNENDYLIAQAGVTGDTSLDVAGRLPGYMDELPAPDYALLASGRNDDLDTQATFEADYEDLCDAVVVEGMIAICRGQIPGTVTSEVATNVDAWIGNVLSSFPTFLQLPTASWPTTPTVGGGVHPTVLGFSDYIAPTESVDLAALLSVGGVLLNEGMSGGMQELTGGMDG